MYEKELFTITNIRKIIVLFTAYLLYIIIGISFV